MGPFRPRGHWDRLILMQLLIYILWHSLLHGKLIILKPSISLSIYLSTYLSHSVTQRPALALFWRYSVKQGTTSVSSAGVLCRTVTRYLQNPRQNWRHPFNMPCACQYQLACAFVYVPTPRLLYQLIDFRVTGESRVVHKCVGFSVLPY